MKKFTSLRLQNLVSSTGLMKLGLVVLAGLMVNVGRAAPPANDNFSAATSISGASGTQAGSNVGATIEPGETNVVNGIPFSATVWYQWSPPTNGFYTFDTIGSPFDTVLIISTGTNVSALTVVAINDDIVLGNSLDSRASFAAVTNQTYKIAVGSYGVSFNGNITLNWQPVVLAPNDNFANATDISGLNGGLYGSTTGNNSVATAEPSEPTHAGVSATRSVWFRWTAPQSGDVELDTLGSAFDTVLAVYTGTGLANLNQVAANNDMYPATQQNQIGQNIFNNSLSVYNTNFLSFPSNTNNFPRASAANYVYTQPFPGPSGLHFNAVAGTTYYFAVDGSSGASGAYTLTWAYHSSGLFRFATENQERTGIRDTNGNPMLLYQCAETETSRRFQGTVDANQYNTTLHTYYTYNVPGVLVTVTRVAGSSGRVTVGYKTVDGNTNMITNGDQPAVAGIDYSPVNGTLVFDDFEMSKTILISIIDNGGTGNPHPNRDFTVQIYNPQLDSAEPADLVSPPRVDQTYYQALVRILDVDIDPKGMSQSVLYSIDGGAWTNAVPSGLTTNDIVVTNTFFSTTPTNAVLNFQKANYRVTRDVTNWWGGTPITVYVTRTGTNNSGATALWSVNNLFLDKQTGDANKNISFPLQPGSDYATPFTASPPKGDWGIYGTTNFDFNMSGAYSGSVSFPAGNAAFDPQPITFTIYDNGLSQFAEDFHIDLYQLDANGNAVPAGMVAETTVTVLFDDLHPPAGSVDEQHNPDFSLNMAPPINVQPLDQPGADGPVYGVAVLPNDESLIVGNFSSYNGVGRSCIALVNNNGLLDTSFDPGGGADDFIHAVAITTNNAFVIGGAFSTYNNSPGSHSGIARVNADGSLDTGFNASADGTVWAVAAQQDGRVLIGGDFTHVNGTPRNYLARLNGDGSLDTTFDPGTTLNGSVYAIGLPANQVINLNRTATGTDPEDDQPISLGLASAGTLTVNYDMQGIPDDMKVFYGTTNVAAGKGVLIYDTGLVSTNKGSPFVLPFGPTNGVTANVITIVMNQGGGTIGTAWGYTASVTTIGTGNGIMVGGDFAVSGQTYRDIARFTNNGALDTAFNPGAGADNPVFALGWQQDGRVVVGGSFTHINNKPYNGIVRLNADGSIDATNFFVGSGANDTVYSLTGQGDGTIYVGGSFTSFNGTHRLGFARLYLDGTVDTTFLDTAYNQLAGLTQVHFNDSPGTVFASGIQSDGNVLIGGSFDQVGGGQFDPNIRPEDYDNGMNQNVWTERKIREALRNRSNFARLVGGATPGPGNVGLLDSTYSINRSQSFLYVDLMRTNGSLGYASANFSVQPGLAKSGIDYTYYQPSPLYPIGWEYRGLTRMHSEGLFGNNVILQDVFGVGYSFTITGVPSVNVSISQDSAVRGNLNAQFQLANPVDADQFYLGGQDIPLGLALGRSGSPFTLVDDDKQPGTFGFSAASYIATNSSAVVSLVRSNGSFGTVSLQYSTSNGTAIAGIDYVGLTNITATFQDGQKTNGFNVTILGNGIINTNFAEKYLNLFLANLNGATNAYFGLSNAVLRLINPNFQGYLTLSSNSYSGTESSGFITFTVNRVAGSKGTVSVRYATANGSAFSGVDYFGATNQLTWNDGDVLPKVVSVTLRNTGVVGGNKVFGVSLFNPTNSSSGSDPALLTGGPITNATLTIINDNSYGTVQFSAPTYLVDENGGYATITVNRTGGIAGPVSVSFATTNGTAFANTNYVATNGVLTFAANQISSSFNVQIKPDGVVDPTNFYFSVLLTNSSNTALGFLTNAVVNIVDAQSFNQPPGSPDPGFNPGAGMNGDVLALALQPNGQILAGGNFTTFNNGPQNYITRLNANGSLDTTFANGPSAGADNSVFAVLCQSVDNRVVIGGAFSQVNGAGRNCIARLMTDGTIDTSFNPGAGADGVIYALAETFVGGTHEIYVGGAFGHVNGVASLGIARMNDDGTADASFATGTGADGSVLAIATYPTNSVQAGKVLIGGAFTHYNGTSQNYIARLNADGSVDATFNPGTAASASVNAIAIQPDGLILVGGSFTNYNGTVMNHIARLNSDGSLDANFVTGVGNANGANDSVVGIALQADNRIVLVGQFTQANGVTRNRITRLLPTGAVDPTINLGDGANGGVAAVVIQPADGMIVIGGSFTQYDDQPFSHIARIYGGSVTGPGSFTFSSSSYQVNESGGQAVLSVRRTGGTSGTNSDGTGNVLVHFATSNGSAVAGVNYTSQNMDLTFPPGEVLDTVFIPVFDDHVITGPLTLTNTLSNPTPPAGLGVQPVAALTILNDDSAVRFTLNNYSQFKNAGSANIDIIRQFGTNGIATVDFYTTTNGTAIAGADYYPTNLTVTFLPGQTDAVVQVSINSGSLSVGDRTVGLLLTNPVNTVLQAPSNATLTIRNPVPGPGQVSFATTNYTANEGDGTAFLTVVRTNGSDSISVSYSLVPGTAQQGVNYNTTGGTVTFGINDTTKLITIPLVDNDIVQGTVNLSAVLYNATGGATLVDPTNATLFITDNDLGFAFVNATNYVSETNTYAPVFVQCIGNHTTNVSVNYLTVPGTALPGVNYTPVSGTNTFAPGETLQAILVPLISNTNATGNLLFSVVLTNATAGSLAAPTNSVVVIQDAQAGLSFTNSAVSVFKNSGSLVVAVVCANPGVEPVIVNSNTVPLSVFYSTADGTAIANQDYGPVSGTLAFTNGIATNYFTVPIFNNSLVMGDRAFTVHLSSPTPPGQVVPPSTQTVTIIDNNSGLSFSTPTYTILKTGVAATITVLRTDNTNTTTSVDFATANGTAVAGLDYLATNGTCLFTNGETSKTFSVIVINNTVVQPDKTVLLQLFNPTNGILIAPYAATLTIHDNSGSVVVPAGSTFTPTGDPNHDGLIDPGETVQLLFAFRAAGGNSVTNLHATLLPINGITNPIPAGGAIYTNLMIVGGPSYSQPFTFTVSPGYTNGQQIVATFKLEIGTTNIGTNGFTFTLGTWSTTYSNLASIIINDYAIASPYPSMISVSNLGGVVVKAVVTLTNITHPSPEDIEVLLVSPNQQDAVIMSRAGKQNALNHVTLTFDDATNYVQLPQNDQIVSGTNQPTAYPPLINFP